MGGGGNHILPNDISKVKGSYTHSIGKEIRPRKKKWIVGDSTINESQLDLCPM